VVEHRVPLECDSLRRPGAVLRRRQGGAALERSDAGVGKNVVGLRHARRQPLARLRQARLRLWRRRAADPGQAVAARLSARTRNREPAHFFLARGQPPAAYCLNMRYIAFAVLALVLTGRRPSEPLVIRTVQIGRSLNSDNSVGALTTRFSPEDTIYASVL